MEAIIVLATAVFLGYALCSVLEKQIITSFKLPYAFLLGSCFSIPLLYCIRVFVFQDLRVAIAGWVLVCLVSSFLVLERKGINGALHVSHIIKLLLFFLISFLSYFVFNKTFSYTNHTFLIATNMYLDLGAHIPFIRSFANNTNYPFEVPFFINGGIQYHFMFDFYTAVLQVLGMRTDIAYNMLSALTISSLFFVFLDFGKNVFKKKSIGFIAFFLFFLPFNYSFFKQLYVSHGNLLFLWRTNAYMSDSFLGNNTVGNFLYLNTYVNQRHLLFSLSSALIFVMILWNVYFNGKSTSYIKAVVLGVLMGLVSFWNMPVFIMSEIVIVMILVLSKNRRVTAVILIASLLTASYQVLQNQNMSHSGVFFNPGFLIYKNFSLQNLFVFWMFNLGLAAVLIFLGLLFSSKNHKKLFLTFIPIFVLPNILQFSTDMFDNHKFFNFFFLFMCFYIAYFIVFLYRKRGMYRYISAVLCVLLVISASTSVLVVKNDIYAEIPDYSYMRFSKYTEKAISKGSIVVTNGEIYDPVSLVGQKTYLGRPQYLYLYGANPEKRISIVTQLFSSNTHEVSSIVKQNMIKYIVIYKGEVKNPIKTSRRVFDRLYKVIYEDGFAVIYKT